MKKEEDIFIEFSDFNEVKEVFEEAIKEMKDEEKAKASKPSYETRSLK
nr:hypothetical protein [Acidianus brierleyi]